MSEYLKVVSTIDGRRRAGRRWSTEPQYLRADQLTASEREALDADPLIVVMAVSAQDLPDAMKAALAAKPSRRGKSAE